MLNVMIVDDEPPARARLGQVLRDCSEQVSLQLVGEAEGGIRDWKKPTACVPTSCCST
jgi:two-component system, LytTR family, response regulator AlgR